MGGCLSIQFSADSLIHSLSSLCSQGYIQSLKQNLKDLEREIEDLKASQDAVRNKVAVEERQSRQRMTEGVKLWLTRVEKTETEYNNLLEVRDIELQKLCMCDLGSKNVRASYKYGKSVFLLFEDVKRLKLDGKFEVVTERILTSETLERPIGPTIGQEKMFEKAWNRLMKDDIGIMGLHGMGGVGKTTLFKQIHNRFTAYKNFNVIWIVVSQSTTISKIQEDIASKLNICDEGWNNKNESDKAAEIYGVLTRKKFVLMLDDIWKEVDLDAIGVPSPSKQNGCKVAFTTRSREVCAQMGDHKAIKVECLDQEEAWELFTTMVGSHILNDPLITEPARKVAEKCGGLPLALRTIGKTMAPKDTVQEWEHAVYVLTRSALKYPNIENILSILKYSYDSLRDEHIKSCFLYCALFPEDDRISKGDLIKYWIYEGFMGKFTDIRKAMNKGYEILGTLIRVNLLMVKSDESHVSIHDVVREMALWIASNFVVQAKVGLHEVPKLKDCSVVRSMSLIGNEIKEITCSSKWSELTTLFLQENNLRNLPSEFIQSMKKLVVLNLSKNYYFSTLPEQVSKLVSLQFMNLSYTLIEQLPDGFQELKNLIDLDLSSTSRLRSVRGLSKLSRLKVLNLIKSKVHGDIIVSEELQPLKHLQILSITISTELGKEILWSPKLQKCISALHILGFQHNPFNGYSDLHIRGLENNAFNISLLKRMENLHDLMVENTYVSDGFTVMYRNTPSPCFGNLFSVEIDKCKGIKDLTWLLFAPNLVSLIIKNVDEVEEIINKKKAANLTRIKPFQKLKFLYLVSLPSLECIYWSPLPFPFLMILAAINCPKLRKFPLNTSSAPRAENFKIELGTRQQLSDFEWEDEDTKNRFLPMIDVDCHYRG